MTRILNGLALLAITVTVVLAFETASAPLLPAQSTTSPPATNSPSLLPPPQTPPQPLTRDDPPLTPKPKAPSGPATMPGMVPGKPANPQVSRPAKPQALPPGSVIAPPGSIVLPPAAVAPPRPDADARRTSAIVRCNQRQITCNSQCNGRSMGTMRSMCYKQCSSLFANCVSKANSLP